MRSLKHSCVLNQLSNNRGQEEEKEEECILLGLDISLCGNLVLLMFRVPCFSYFSRKKEFGICLFSSFFLYFLLK